MADVLQFVEYGGVRYYLMRHGYFMSARGAYLHRVVWADANGPIPFRHQVHHKNKVRGDNRLENLECMHVRDHMRLHGKEPKKKAAKSYGPMECIQCRVLFEKKRPKHLCCSRPCTVKRSNAVRHSRVADTRKAARASKQCLCCSVVFTPNRSDATHCTPRCASVMAKRAYNARQRIAA